MAAFKGAEAVFHLAALVSIDAVRPEEFHRTNVEGTRNVVEAALACGVRRLVHVSSIHAYDQRPLDEALDESRGPADGPRHGPYDRSKAAGEVEVRRGIDRGLDAVILNPTSVIGPCDGGPSPMGQVFLDLYRRRIPALIAGGYDWVDVRRRRLCHDGRRDTGENVARTTSSQVTGTPCANWRSFPSRRPVCPRPASSSRCLPPGCGHPARSCWIEAADAVRSTRRSPSASWPMAIGGYPAPRRRRNSGSSPRSLAESVRDTYRWFDEHGMLGERA